MSNVGALIIGAAAGVIVVGSVLFFVPDTRRRSGRGDLGPRCVRAFGALCVGLFTTAHTDFWKQGLFYGGGAGQLVTQLIGVVTVGAFVALTAGRCSSGSSARSACA